MLNIFELTLSLNFFKRIPVFFSISKESFDERFTKFKKVNDVYVSLDPGWTHKIRDNYEVFFKGYCDDSDIETIISDAINNPCTTHHGSYCLILIVNNEVIVSHSYTRPFYLWVYNINTDKYKITNLPYEQYSTQYPFIVWENENYLYTKLAKKSENQTYVHSHQILKISDTDASFFEYNPYTIDEIDNKISLQECVDYIHEILKDKATQFGSLIESKQVKMYLSGGLDTMLVYSYIKEHVKQDNFEFGEHFERDEFVDKNLAYLNNTFTHYQSIYLHYWNTPTVFATGGGGEEFLFKEFYATALWSAWKGIDFIKLLQSKKDNFYRKYYYQRPGAQKVFNALLLQQDKIREMFPTYHSLCQYIIKLKLNEFQHWHLSNTLTWTPLNDVRITKLILRLHDDDILNHFMYNTIEFGLFNKTDPTLKSYISNFKNFNDHENLIRFKPYKIYFAKQIVENKNKKELYNTVYRKLNVKEHTNAGIDDNENMYNSKW